MQKEPTTLQERIANQPAQRPQGLPPLLDTPLRPAAATVADGGGSKLCPDTCRFCKVWSARWALDQTTTTGTTTTISVEALAAFHVCPSQEQPGRDHRAHSTSRVRFLLLTARIHCGSRFNCSHFGLQPGRPRPPHTPVQLRGLPEPPLLGFQRPIIFGQQVKE